MTEIERVCREFTCDYCHAAPGEPCRQYPSGRRSVMAHSPRWWAAKNAGRFDDGEVAL